MLTYLPESLIIEILSWLPVKSLIRFKRVNKSWYEIIKSRYFISMHLKHEYGRRTNCFIAQFQVPGRAHTIEAQLLWHGESDESNTIQDNLSLQNTYNYNICGPCYGIYYLWPSFVGEYKPGRLWNPALNEIKKLPPMIMNSNISSNMEFYREICGFGFDTMSVDYKVVVFMEYRRGKGDGWKSLLNRPFSIMIYSLRADSWKYSGDLSKPYRIGDHSCHAFVNTSLYWLAGSIESLSFPFIYDVIIAIDLTTEECQEIGLPDTLIKKQKLFYSQCLMVYNGSIALVALSERGRIFEIWTLKASTWNKELTVELKFDLYLRRSIGHYSVDNNLVLFDGEQEYEDYLILCNPNTKETSRFEVGKNGYLTYHCKTVSAYMESLVPLNDRDFWGSKDEDRENRNKSPYPLIME